MRFVAGCQFERSRERVMALNGTQIIMIFYDLRGLIVFDEL
ncbi:MAG: hypothetical protein JWO09_1486 [Bacteroidetes bacterium]|nr:hypothetical protein [Bacteroidota bacterium]